MKLSIEKPKFYGKGVAELICYPGNRFDFDSWFDTHVTPINKLLENAVEVYTGASGIWTTHKENAGITHKALLITIEPINQETERSLLEEYVLNIEEGRVWNTSLFLKRVRAVLNKEKGE